MFHLLQIKVNIKHNYSKYDKATLKLTIETKTK